MKMYDEQPLEAAQVTSKDLRKLRRLKKKAEKNVEVKSESEQATSIKIEEPNAQDNIEAVIR